MLNPAALAFALSLSLSSLTDHISAPNIDMIALRFDLQRFPDCAECQRQINRANEHLEYIDGHIKLFAYDRADWQAYREQVVAWRGIWSDLQVCRTGWLVGEDVCRMRRIRAALGEDWYAAGYVPPPIASYLRD